MISSFAVLGFDVIHHRPNRYDHYILHHGAEVFHFLTRVINAIKFNLSGFELLACGHGLVQIGAGSVDLFAEKIRGVFAGRCSLSRGVVGLNTDAMMQAMDLDTAFTARNVDRAANVRAAVVFES